MKGMGAAAVVLGALLAAPASAQAATRRRGRGDLVESGVRHPGARRRTASPRASSTEVRGKDVLVITGRFGFKTYDVERPGEAEAAGRVHPGRPRRGRLLAERGHGARHEAQADHRRARSSPHRQSAGRVPGGRQHVEPGLQERVLRHLLREPVEHEADRRLRRPAVRPHVELHPELQVHLDRRPGAAQRPALARADPRARPRRRRTPSPALVGDGRPIWVTDLTNPYKPEVSDQPVDIWRNDGYTDYSHDVDEDDEGIAWVSGRGGIRGYATDGYAPRPVPEPLAQGHAVRAGAGRRRRRRRHRAARDADAQLRPSDRRLGARLGRQAGQRARGHRGGVHAAVRGRAARSCCPT